MIEVVRNRPGFDARKFGGYLGHKKCHQPAVWIKPFFDAPGAPLEKVEARLGVADLFFEDYQIRLPGNPWEENKCQRCKAPLHRSDLHFVPMPPVEWWEKEQLALNAEKALAKAMRTKGESNA